MLSEHLKTNIQEMENRLPIKKSFDFIERKLYIGQKEACLFAINGMTDSDILQQIISDLQKPALESGTESIDKSTSQNLVHLIGSEIGYAQVNLSDSMDEIVTELLKGPSVLFIEGFSNAVLLDVRNYPKRSISEPDTEKITRGPREGFVETLLQNANLIRRRIRSPKLTFELHNVGDKSCTDISVIYMENLVNKGLLDKIREKLDSLSVTSLTMGSKSLEELLIPKHWWNPLPNIQQTERPDVACSYLLEGHILIMVDNSPITLILPCTIFQFLQSPEDYYKNPLVGAYFRMVRFFCIPVSLLLLPLFLLITAYYPDLSRNWQLLSTGQMAPARIIFYVFAVEFLLDLFKYSASLSSSRFSGSLSIIGGLLIGDMTVQLNWASMEILFYAAVTLLASYSMSSMEFAEAVKIYRILLLIAISFFGTKGFIAGLILMFLSIITTPTFGGMSYFWPLFPFNGEALCNLLFRRPTAKVQPDKVWKRGDVK